MHPQAADLPASQRHLTAASQVQARLYHSMVSCSVYVPSLSNAAVGLAFVFAPSG